jgi:hypothetical protein
MMCSSTETPLRAVPPRRSPRGHGAATASRHRRVVIPSSLLLFLVLLLAPSQAWAYPWMIARGHLGCVQCHMDPSGSGLLTSYGREQGDEELPMHWGRGDVDTSEIQSGPVWGRVTPPDWLLVGGGFRAAFLGTEVSGAPAMPGAPANGLATSVILMQADLRAGIRLGGFRASASLGVVTDKSYADVVGNLVSREHWVGYSFDHDTWVLRAGRITVPFGIRSIEHTLWVRQQSRTDINDTQQYGIALAYTSRFLRAEAMGLLGNYQISPDAFRERGYSATLEVLPIPAVGIGVSSLITHADEDISLLVENTRQAHGLFVRASPVTPLVLFGEGDLVFNSPKAGPATTGFASMIQGDLQPVQGIHFILTGETWTEGAASNPGKQRFYGGWAAIDWFCLRQFDLRTDFMWRQMNYGSADRIGATAFLVQAHLYL